MKINLHYTRLRRWVGALLLLLLWFTLWQPISAHGQPNTSPTLTSLSPNSGPAGIIVTLNGTNLTGTSIVIFLGTSSMDYIEKGFSVNPAGTQITGVVIPARPPGTYKIEAYAPSTGTSNYLVFNVTAASAPVIDSFTPAFTKSGQTVTISGSNLNGATALTFSGVAQPTFAVNAAGTQLTAAVPYTSAMSSSPDLPSGLIQVTTPGGTAASATPLRLLAVTSATTSAGTSGYPGGLAGDNVTISGSGFAGANVAFSLNSATYQVSFTVVSETQITAVVPDLSGSTAPGGNGGFVVTNTPGLSGANFEVLSPVISSLSPASGPAGTVVTVTGFNFQRNDPRSGATTPTAITGFTFNGVAGTNFQLMDFAHARVTVPAGAATGYVRPTGGSLQEGYSKGVVLTVTASAPTLTGITPGNGPAGTSLTLTGTNLTGTTAVTFAGSSGNVVTTGFAVNAAGTQITGVVVPAGAQSGPVTATTPAGTSNGIAFTAEPCPVATVAYGAASYCRSGANPTPTVTGPTGGTFSAPTGLSLDPATGVIVLGSSTPGTYTVSYAAGTAACPTRATAQVSVTAPPVAAFAYGASSYCLNATSAVPAVLTSGAMAGTFTATPAGLSLDATTGAIALTGSQPGTYTVTNTVAAGGGCAAVAATSTVTLNAVPAAALTASSPTTFCAGGSVVLSAGGGATGATYQFQRDGTPIPGATATTYAATTAGAYAVVVTGAGGCAATSAPVQVGVNPLPPTPTLSAQFNGPVTTLTSSSATGNQFYLKGVAISGATAQSYVVNSPAQLGSYTVVVTNAAGCASAASNPLTVTSSLKPVAGTTFSVFPNPTHDGNIAVTLTGYHQAVELVVVDALGRVALRVAVPASNGSPSTQFLSLKALASGIYLLRAQTAGGLDLRRVIKE